MKSKKKGKILAVLLSGMLLGTQIPATAASEVASGYTGGICEHHPEHTAECGYQEAVPEQPCLHVHTEECYEYVTSCIHGHTEECYPLLEVVSAEAQDTEGTEDDAGSAEEPQTELVRGSEPTACTHICSEESGCVTKTLNCIHEDKINADGSITYAVHDENCGYAPAVEGKECTFVCEICSTPEKPEEVTEVPEEENVGVPEEETVGEQEDAAVTALQKRINELPDVETVKQMTSDEQNAVYNQAQNIADTYYDELTEEQQRQVDLTRLMDLLNYFNGQVSTMADLIATGDGWELDSDGLLKITSSRGLEIPYNHWASKYLDSIKSIIIENGVVGSLCKYLFEGCSELTSVTIDGGAKIESIGEGAFSGCNRLTSITIPYSVTSIGTSAFQACNSLTSITIPYSVTSIGDRAFCDCPNLRKVTLPATAPTTVSNDSFESWDYINFIIPETSIGTGDGQYNLNDKPWNQIRRLNEMVIDNGKSVIFGADVSLVEPTVGAKLPSQADSRTENVTASVSWSPDAEAAAYGIAYTATIKLSANTSATPIGYTFTNYTEVYLNESWLWDGVEVADDGSTLTFTKTYQMPKQSQSSPVISIDYQNETLNTTEGMEYSTDEGKSWTTCSADMKVAVLGWDGTEKSVQIRMKETANAYASDPASVTIPARPASPNIQADGSTASSINVQAAGVSQEAAVQYQLVADGDSIDSKKWQQSGKFTNLKADTDYTAYAKCGATTSSFASDTSSGQTVSTAAAAYTVTIPSEVIAGDSTSKGKAEIFVNTSKSFDLGYNGQVQVKVESNGAVSTDGKLTLTRQGASDTITSAMLVNGTEFTDINKPVAVFKMDNYNTAKEVVSFAQPKTTDTTQTVIPAGTYSGTVSFEVSYSD